MSATDPSDFVRNPPSVIVKVQNTSQESVNGKLGIVVQYTQERGRYLVHLTETQQSVALKPENLVKASMFEQAKAQYQQLTKDPQIKREITKYYNLAASKLPPNVKPEHAAAGFGVALLLAMYFVGFTRVLMVITMIFWSASSLHLTFWSMAICPFLIGKFLLTIFPCVVVPPLNNPCPC